jgi:hypothetical protein
MSILKLIKLNFFKLIKMEPKKAHQVHHLIILDESGSMESIKKKIIDGFNELVQTIQGIERQFPEQLHLISAISFNGLGTKILHFIDPVSKLNALDSTKYKPDANTPLYDAMGFSIGKLRQVLENQLNFNVLVTVLTDGEENASKEYSNQSIKALIENLQLKTWTFTYIGTDHAVEMFAESIAIKDHLTFSKDDASVEEMFLSDRNARMEYSKKLQDRNYQDYDEQEERPSYFKRK